MRRHISNEVPPCIQFTAAKSKVAWAKAPGSKWNPKMLCCSARGRGSQGNGKMAFAPTPGSRLPSTPPEPRQNPPSAPGATARSSTKRGQTAAAVTRSPRSSSRRNCPVPSSRFRALAPGPAPLRPAPERPESKPPLRPCPSSAPPSWRAAPPGSAWPEGPWPPAVACCPPS